MPYAHVCTGSCPCFLFLRLEVSSCRLVFQTGQIDLYSGRQLFSAIRTDLHLDLLDQVQNPPADHPKIHSSHLPIAEIGKQVLGTWDFHTPGRSEHRCFRGDRLVSDADDRPHITLIRNGLQTEGIHRGQWNKVHIIARDNHFMLYINGKLASQFTEHLPSDKRLQRGMMQLQLHDPGMVVEFKNIVLKVLD